MKKILKGLICAGLAGAMAAGTVLAAGCNNNSGKSIIYRDTESDALKLAIGALDEKFNPLFYTSLNDGTIANLTQASLITTNAKGELTYGENEPTVALDYLETYYSEDGAKLATGNGKDVVGPNGNKSNGDQNGSTTYEFLIKNGMKFSDGVDVTVMDVLFNLYVYLDPMYSGSSTIYSTKIKGMQAYRQNDPNADDNDTGADESSEYYVAAVARYDNLYKWADGTNSSYNEQDLIKVMDLYEKSLNSDWNSIATNYTETYKDYYFTEAWQAFFFMKGVFGEQKKPNSNGVSVRFKDGNGKYPTEIDPKADDAVTNLESNLAVGEISSLGQSLIAEMAGVEDEKTAAIDYLYNANAGGYSEKESGGYDITENKDGIKKILSQGLFSSTVISAFYDEEMTNAANSETRVVKSISGITVSHTGDSEHNGYFNGVPYEDDHDILKIEIVGVDPKAKWNFAFAVAPLHYYSGTYNGKNYVTAAMAGYEKGDDNCAIYKGTAEEFGVKWKDANFIDDVLSTVGKNGVPVGAGPYKCTDQNRTTGRPSRTGFFDGTWAYFVRNEQFTTLGTGVENAKIKYVQYRVMGDDKIVSALKTGEIDYGEPIAKAANKSELTKFEQTTFMTGGYGYIGINPKYVPDIEIRRAIMMTFDTTVLYDYYGRDLVNIITRPMSMTSWVFKKEEYVGGMPKDAYYTYTSKAQDIKDYIEANGNWSYSNGTWTNEDGREGLSINFTIAGDTVDHPAYNIFVNAKNILEKAGFNVTVGTDPQALQKLVTGDLEVWAAAWSSSIDPDPYQIYSKYSKATSTNNWNKDNIVNDASGKFDVEKAIVDKLSDKIDAGRQTLDERERAEIYALTKGDDKCALDLIMDLAVEFPTYQRNDFCVWNGSVLDQSTMHIADASHYIGPISELWKVNYYVRSSGAEN